MKKGFDTFLNDLNIVRDQSKKKGVNASSTDVVGMLAAILHMCDRLDALGYMGDLTARMGEEPVSRKHDKLDAPYALCHYVFAYENRNRDVAWKNTMVLRNARKHGIRPLELAHYIRGQGGLGNFYDAVRQEAATIRTKVLKLDKAVDVPRDGQLHLIVDYAGDGNIHVVHAKPIWNKKKKK